MHRQDEPQAVHPLLSRGYKKWLVAVMLLPTCVGKRDSSPRPEDSTLFNEWTMDTVRAMVEHMPSGSSRNAMRRVPSRCC